MKYRPEFPARFGSIQDALSFCQEFFTWYNGEHHHSGIAETVHYGLAQSTLAARQEVLNEAYQRHPERFVKQPPIMGVLPEAVWKENSSAPP